MIFLKNDYFWPRTTIWWVCLQYSMLMNYSVDIQPESNVGKKFRWRLIRQSLLYVRFSLCVHWTFSLWNDDQFVQIHIWSTQGLIPNDEIGNVKSWRKKVTKSEIRLGEGDYYGFFPLSLEAVLHGRIL